MIGAFAVPSSIASVTSTYQRHVLRAVTAVVRQHPNLRLQIRRSKQVDHFVHLRVLDIGKLVEWWQDVYPPFSTDGDTDSDRCLEGFLSDQNSTPFTDPLKPLWRIICFPMDSTKANDNSTGPKRLAICFVYHHAIADGMSGSAVLAALRDALADGKIMASDEDGHGKEEGNEADFTLRNLPGEISPSMDDLIPYHLTWKSWLRSASHRTWQRLGLRGACGTPVWTGDVAQLPAERNDARARTLIRVIRLSVARTKRLQERCKAHSTSITAMLQVLVGSALFARYPEAQALRCATALSLRRFLPPSAGIDNAQLGVWIDAFTWIYKRDDLHPGLRVASEDALWKVMHDSKRKINRQIRKGLNDLSFASLQGKSDFKPQLRDLLGKPRANTYSITNLGLLPEKKQVPREASPMADAWSLESVLFSQSAHVNGSAVQFCAVSCEKGGLSISMNWQDHVVQEGDMDQVKTLLEGLLLRWSS